MAGASRYFGNPLQKYTQKKRPTKLGLIFRHFPTNIPTKCPLLGIFPPTLSDIIENVPCKNHRP